MTPEPRRHRFEWMNRWAVWVSFTSNPYGDTVLAPYIISYHLTERLAESHAEGMNFAARMLGYTNQVYTAKKA